MRLKWPLITIKQGKDWPELSGCSTITTADLRPGYAMVLWGCSEENHPAKRRPYARSASGHPAGAYQQTWQRETRILNFTSERPGCMRCQTWGGRDSPTESPVVYRIPVSTEISRRTVSPLPMVTVCGSSGLPPIPWCGTSTT